MKVVCLPGDGIGPEVTEEARRTIEVVARKHGAKLAFEEHLIGGIAIDLTGTALPQTTLEACRSADAVLLGAVGGPKWDDPSAKVRPEQGLLAIRRALDLFANLRPVRVHPALAELSPLRPERVEGVDILFVRELTSGIYFGEPRFRETTDEGTRAVDTLSYTDREVRRVVRLAFGLAGARKKRVTSVDKANVLESSRLWRSVAVEVANDFPEVALEHQLVDSCAMRLVTHAKTFDVVVAENMFGDILTDEAAVLAGSIGLLPSASIGDRRIGLYEPIHGSAPDIAGKARANPIGAILSGAMLLRHSLGLEEAAQAIERAVDRTIEAGARTADLGGTLGTKEMGRAVREHLG
ncbi:MAG: 3-isopropylmalate dehydrogenase [Deltaproteobacteria bacterium]|nr:3-isopropylmalate dehydrogenase [Deltaproteobacteria bacterium]